MDQKESLYANSWTRHASLPSPGNGSQTNSSSDPPSFPGFGLQQNPHKWDDPSISDYGIRVESLFKKFNQPSQAQPILSCNSNSEIKISDQENCQLSESSQTLKIQNWDPNVMLGNLSFLEEKIHQLRHLIVSKKEQAFVQPNEPAIKEQQLITADLMSIIVQLISTAGGLLPSAWHNITNPSPLVRQFFQLQGTTVPSGSDPNSSCIQPQDKANILPDQSLQNDLPNSFEMEQKYKMEEHELNGDDDADDGENLPPVSYEILQLEKEEILAPHTHFCTICGKGFKRDANLRMHMRGHGDEYKTAAALAKPQKESGSEQKLIKRYSCPYAGCKRNKDHKKFQPLKTILCVKNHYKRTHCDKSFTCSRCHIKKFSVMADLKTHEKHCGRDKALFLWHNIFQERQAFWTYCSFPRSYTSHSHGRHKRTGWPT